MGREIRRVPANWEHPKNERSGHLQPMHDHDFESAARAWLDAAIAWDNGTHPDAVKHKRPDYCLFYWQWAGGPPDEDYCRPKWSDEQRTHFQIYETVSEVSPVFATLEALVDWMVNDGGRDGRRSRAAAEAFAKGGWTPSLVVQAGPGGFVEEGVAGLHRLAQKEQP